MIVKFYPNKLKIRQLRITSDNSDL